MLALRTILVEGPSDELIVQKAYMQKYGMLPLQAAVEVISVGTSFKRFLDIAKQLKIDVAVVRDNDGDAAGKQELFREYDGEKNISIHIDTDDNARTLEPQLIKSNGLEPLNAILKIQAKKEDELLEHMSKNKTDVALKLFEYEGNLEIPKYIQDAIR